MRKTLWFSFFWLMLLVYAEGWISVGIGLPGMYMVGYSIDRAYISISIDPSISKEIAFTADWALAQSNYLLPTPWGTTIKQESRLYVGLTGSYFYQPYIQGNRNYAFGAYLGYGSTIYISNSFRHGVNIGTGLRSPPDLFGQFLFLGSSEDLGLFMYMNVHLDFVL